MTLTNTTSAGILDQIFSGTAFASITGDAYATLTTTPGGTEVSGTGYSRQLVSYGAATAAQPSVATAAEIDFGTVAGDWTPTTGIDIVDFYTAASGGAWLYSGTDTSINYSVGNRAFVRAGHTFSIGTNALFTASYLQTIVDWLVNGGSAPAQLTHAGLLASGTELSGGNYARLDVSSLWGTATSADPAVKSFSGGAALFTTGATYSGSPNQIGFYTAATGGTPQCTLSYSAETITGGGSEDIEINPTITLT